MSFFSWCCLGYMVVVSVLVMIYGDIMIVDEAMLHIVPRMNVLLFVRELGQSHYYSVLDNQEENNASCFHAQDISNVGRTMST